jgi:hypothetical protein
VSVYSILTKDAYPEFPTAKYSVALYIKCNYSLCASALAYRLWFINDSTYFLYEKSGVPIAISYVFLGDGVYAFCLYDSGIEDDVNATARKVRSNLIISQSHTEAALIGDQTLERRILRLLS